MFAALYNCWKVTLSLVLFSFLPIYRICRLPIAEVLRLLFLMAIPDCLYMQAKSSVLAPKGLLGMGDHIDALILSHLCSNVNKQNTCPPSRHRPKDKIAQNMKVSQ